MRDTASSAVERIHFSRKSTQSGESFRHVQALRLFGLLGLGGLVFPGIRLLRTLGVSYWFSVPPVPIIGAGLWLWWYLARRRAREGRTTLEGSLPAKPDDSVRIRCVGLPGELEGVGPLADLPFEPAIFHAALAIMPLKRTLWTVWILTAVVSMAALWATEQPSGAPALPPFPFVIWVAYVLGMGVAAVLNPVYFRIVPGRLDVLWYGMLRSKPTRVDHRDLKSSKVLVDLRRSALFIEDGPFTFDSSFALVPGRRRLAYTLLLAALSTHEPGPIPDDELLG